MKPKLRFQGFHDDWEEKKLGEISTVYSGGTPKSTVKEYYQGNIPFIRSGEIHSNMTELAITHEAIENSSAKWVNKGDLLYAMYGATAGDVSISKIKGVINQAILCINTNQNKKFIEQFLTLNKDKYLTMYLQGGQGNLSSQLIKNYNIFLPSLPEQEKIGAFLGQLDDRIEKQEQKIALLKERKKGWMQQLFSQNIRFKDENGQDYPAWEEKKLGEVLEEVSNKTTINNQYTLLSSTNTGLYNQLEYFKNQVASKDNIGYKILKRNQLVLSPQNLWLGNINFNNKFDVGIVSPSYKIFNIKNENLNFINYLLHTSKAFYFYKNASEQGASIVRRNLNMDLFYDISFSIPSLPEQEKIAEFLSKQDELIEKEEEKLSLLKEQKKGFLQQMFV